MALTFQKKGAGYALPYNSGMVSIAVRERIDIPKIIAAGVYSGLAYTSAPNTGVALASTGFADGDILKLWFVPKGTLCQGVGTYVITAEGATCTIDVGCQTAAQVSAGKDIDGAGVFDLNATGLDGTADTDGWGTDTLPAGELYITDGSIDVEWNHDATAVAEFEIWAHLAYVGNLTANE